MIIDHIISNVSLQPSFLPHTPPFSTLQQQQHNHKRKREQQENMSETPPPPQQQQQQQTTTPHSSSSSQFQFHPTTPEKFTHCFSCKEKGHWANTCPHKTPNNSNNNNKPVSATTLIWCRCGHGVCGDRESHSENNNGRRFYTCPIKRGARCSWVKWCDRTVESDLQPPLFKYPECECGAGVCRKVMVPGQNYFTCPIQKNHGSCGYRVSEYKLRNKAINDELVNNTSLVPIRQSRHRDFNEFFGGDQTDTAVKNLANDLSEGSDLLLNTKRMRITEGSENPSPAAVSEIPEGKCGGSPIEAVILISEIPEGKCGGSPMEVTNLQPISFPEIEFEDDLELINLASLEEIEAAAVISSRFSTPSRISCRQSVFQKEIFSADTSFGIFPSINPTVIPKQTSTINSQSECRDVVIKSPNQCTQLSPGSEEKLKGFLIEAQQRLLDELENLNFDQHKSMRLTAEATFFLLNCSGFQCKQFCDYVWDFINLAKSMAEIDKSMENSPTLEEYSKFLEEEKVKMANIKDDCMTTEALLHSSNQKRNLLYEEVSHLEAVLREKQNELKICDLETMKAESRLGDIKRRMSEVDVTIEDRVKQAEVARKKVAERDRKQIAARTALEKAKQLWKTSYFQ